MKQYQAIKYRIYSISQHNISILTKQYLEGATLTAGGQLYKGGESKPVTIVEYLGCADDVLKVQTLAQVLRDTNDLSCVWFTSEPVELTIIEIESTLKFDKEQKM